MKIIRVFLTGLIVLMLAGMLLAQSGMTKIRFSVLDEQNQVVKDLQTDDLRILVDKKPAWVNSLKLSGELPLQVLILIDCSASQERTLPVEKLFAAAFIDRILKKNIDTVGVAKFSNSVDFLYEPGADFPTAKSKLQSIVFEKPPGWIGGGVVTTTFPPPANTVGSTSIFDTVDKGISLLDRHSTVGKRNIVLLISDGVNTYGQKRLKDLVNTWRLSDVSVYSIGIGDTNYDGVDAKTLRKITDATGGITVVPSKKSGDSDIAKLGNSMRFIYEASITGQIAPEDASSVSIKLVSPRTKDKRFQVNLVSVK